MIPQALFQTYTRERKLVAPPGYRLDCLDRLTRLTPLAPDLEGVVMFSELSASAIEEAITKQIDYFRSLGRSFEWKVYSLDCPADLSRRLEKRSFVAGDPEAFMVYHVRSPTRHQSQRIQPHRHRWSKGDEHKSRINRHSQRGALPALRMKHCPRVADL